MHGSHICAMPASRTMRMYAHVCCTPANPPKTMQTPPLQPTGENLLLLGACQGAAGTFWETKEALHPPVFLTGQCITKVVMHYATNAPSEKHPDNPAQPFHCFWVIFHPKPTVSGPPRKMDTPNPSCSKMFHPQINAPLHVDPCARSCHSRYANFHDLEGNHVTRLVF